MALPAVAFLGVALALGVMLFPSAHEQALMHVEAGRPDRAEALLDSRVRSGEHSPLNVSTLARLRAAGGDLKGAIDLTADALRSRPGDLGALTALAGYYRAADMPRELATTLERLQQFAPEARNLRELAALYSRLGMAGRQRGALQQLLLKNEPIAAPGDYLALAKLLADADPAGAADVIDRLAARHPGAVDVAVTAMQMAALRADGRIQAAIDVGRRWIDAGPGRATVAAPVFARALLPGRHYAEVAAFLSPYAAPDDAHPAVVAVWAQAQIDAGGATQALARLQRAARHGIGDAELRLLHVRLALALGAFDDALVNARLFGMAKLPPADLATFCSAAVDLQRLDVVREALTSVGVEALAAQPQIAAKALLALGDLAAARRWSAAADAALGADPVRRVQLARVQLRLNESAQALASLRRATAKQLLEPMLMPEVARLYIDLGAAAEGRRLFEQASRHNPSRSAGEAWALTAAASGYAAEVISWLNESTRHAAGAEYYRDLTYVAMNAGAGRLAVEAARRLVKLSPTPADRLLVAHSLLAANQADEALPYLRSLARLGSQERSTYESALMGAWHKGQPVLDELRQVWVQKLAQARSPDQRAEAVSVLVELGAYPDVLPAMAELAADEPQRWLGAFADVATRAGKPALLPAVWSRVGENTGAPRALREQVVFRLLEAGHKDAAERIARSLAEKAAPDDAALRRLLYLWGPRPSAQQLDWLERRARLAPPAEKGAWLQHMVAGGAARRVIVLHGSLFEATNDAGLNDAYLEALRSLGDKATIAQALRKALDDGRPRGAHEWRRWAQLAQYLGNADLHRRSLRALTAAGGANAETHRTLAMLAHGAKDFPEAERELDVFIAATGGDLESHLLLGEISAKRGKTDASQALERALAMIDAKPQPTYEERAARARLLVRLKREPEALPVFASLVAERRGDTNLRADYAATLLSAGRLDEARSVLAPR